MPRLEPGELEKALARADFEPRPVYLIYGSEPRRIINAASALREKLIARLGEDNYYRHTRLGEGQDDVSAAGIVARLNTVSMFGGGKAVWIGPLDSLKKEEAETLLAYAQNPEPRSTLIITVATPKGDKKALAAFDKSPFVKAIEEKWPAIKFEAPKGPQMAKWAEARFKSKGLTAGRDAVERLVELCDGDLDRIDGEVDKLSSYAGDEKEITLKDVEDTVGDHKENAVWDLTAAVRRRDEAAAAAALRNLLDHNQPPQLILKMLATEISRLAVARNMRENGGNFDAFAAAAGGSVFPLKMAWEDSSRWTRQAALGGLRKTLAANLDMILRGATPEAALFRLAGALCARPTANPERPGRRVR